MLLEQRVKQEKQISLETQIGVPTQDTKQRNIKVLESKLLAKDELIERLEQQQTESMAMCRALQESIEAMSNRRLIEVACEQTEIVASNLHKVRESLREEEQARLALAEEECEKLRLELQDLQSSA